MPMLKDLSHTTLGLCDTQPLFRSGVAAALREAGVKALFEAESLPQLIRELSTENVQADLILVGIHDRSRSEFKALCRQAALSPEQHFLVLGSGGSVHDIRKLIDLGVRGYMDRMEDLEALITGVHFVLSGGVYCSPHLLLAKDRLSTAIFSEVESIASGVEEQKARLASGQIMTRRQEEVLACLLQGLANKEIARALDMSAGTAKNHVAALLRMLGLTNRRQVLTYHFQSRNADHAGGRRSNGESS